LKLVRLLTRKLTRQQLFRIQSHLKLADRLEFHGFARKIFLWGDRIGKNVEQEGAGARSVHAEGNNVANDGLHDKALEGDAIVGEFLIAVIELEVVVEDEATLHIRGHRNAHCGRSRVIREDHSAVSLIGKVQTVAEEERAHKR